MRTLLVCCLAVLAVAASVPKPFKGQQSYVYRFDTQVSSSLIGASPAEIQQAAATRLRADAVLSFTNERHMKVQLQHIRFGELNSELPKTQRVQPLEHFERKEVPAELKQILEKPFAVSIVDGVVERVEFEVSDSVWSKNIKRAVLNMLQLNLKRNNVQGMQMQSTMPEQQNEKDNQVFSVPEVTLEGECEALYSIQKQQRYGSDDDERSTFNVTKTINFNKCEKTADITYGYQANPAEELRCLNCLRQQKTQDGQQREAFRHNQCQRECMPSKINEDKDVERSTFARFELIGKPERYAIKRTSMMSQYIVKAQNPATQNTLIQVIALSELTFKEQPENQKQIPSLKQTSAAESLLYQPDYDLAEKRFFMYGDEEFEKSPFEKVSKKDQKIAHAIRSIIRQWADKKQGYEMNTALDFHRLVEVMRQSTVQEIQNLEQVMIQVAKEQQESQQPQQNEKLAKTLYLDALASAATRNSLKVLEQKIKQHQVSAPKAIQLLKTYAANQHSPSQRQAEIIESIAKSEVAQQSKPLKQAAWLTFGQTVGAICQNKPSQAQRQLFRVEELCPKSKQEQYAKTLVQLWKEADTIYEQILALKVAGNAALDITLPELQKIVKEKQEPTLVRMEAIDAMRRLRTGHPQKIQQVLLPVFQNQREQPEIRMAAFSMLMYTHPEKSILDQLTFTVINDRSQNVKSFVLTTMDALSKSPSSAEQEIASHMKAALKMVKMEAEQLRSSRKYRVPVYVSEQENTEEQNIFLSLASIVSPTNMLPIHLSSSIRSAFNGEATEENMQLSISQKNLEQWFERISEFAQNYAGSNDEEKDNMERQSSKDLRQIYSSLGIKNRRTGSYYLSSEDDSEEQQQMQGKKTGESQPFGMIVLRTNDVDQVIVPLSENQLPQIIKQLLNGEKPSLMSQVEEMSQRITGNHQFQQSFGFLFNEKRTKLPTSSGLPLALTRHVATVVSAQGQLKLSFQSENLDSRRGLNAELKLRTSAIVSHVHKAAVWSPVLVSGVQTIRTIEANGPMDLKLRADGKKVEIKTRLPQEEQHLRVGLHSLPVTFVSQFNMQSRTEGQPRVRTVHNWQLEHAQYEYQSQPESAIQVEGHVHKVNTLKQIVNALYTTENNAHVYYKPNENTPKELTLRITTDMFQKHSKHSRPEMDTFHSSSKGFQPIYSEDFEGMDLEKDEDRRERLSSYSQNYNGQDAYKHNIRVEAEAQCGQKTHKAAVKLEGACDSKIKHCKLFIDAERTPLHTESQEWTMKAKIQTVAPEIISNDEEPTKKQSRMLVQIESEWGSEKRSSMNVRIQAEPTKKTYWKSESQQKWSRFLNKIDLVADYQLQPRTKHTIQRLYELVKAPYFWQLSVQDHRSNDGDVVRASIVIDPITRQHANISVQTPTERFRLEQVELPVRMSPYNLQRRPSNIRSFGHLISSVTNFGGAQCKADEQRIKTFDGVSYRAPMTDCWSVLAKDCSREEPRFVVLMKKSESEKKVKIVLQEKTIEIIAKQQQKPLVKIDNQQINGQEELSEEGIELTYNTVYVKRSGLNLKFDGEEVQIQLSGMYKSLQCGLCGHYNEEEEDTFRMSNNQRSSSLKQFHKSYQLQNQECNQSQLNKLYENSEEFEIERRQPNRRQQQQQQNSWFDSESEEEDRYDDQSDERWDQSRESRKQGPKPIKRTKVVEYSHKLCFSTEPVKRCPQGTQPDQESNTEEKNVKFFCVDRSSVDARRLQRQVRDGKIIDAGSFQPSFNEKVEEPTKCVKAY